MDSVDRCTCGAEAAASRSVLLVKPMNLKEMAEEYRQNADKLKEHIDKLKARDISALPHGERVNLQGKIRYLEGLRREALSTAKYLEEYFRLQNR